MTQEQSTFFNEFYQEYFKSLTVYAYRFLSDWEDAYDATQEAFKTAIIKINDFYGSENPIGWIKKTIRKTAANMNRTRKVRNDHTATLGEARLRTTATERYEDSAIAYCAELLPPEEFAIIKETILAGEPCSKVYENFGPSYEAFRKRMTRILQKLRNAWDT